MAQAQLRPPGDIADDFRLSVLADVHEPAQTRLEAIVPRGLDQDATCVAIASLGDITLSLPLARRVLRRYQAEESHQFSWMGEASEVADFGDQRYRGDEVDSTQARERRHEPFHAPLFRLCSKGLGKTLHSIMALERPADIRQRLCPVRAARS